VNVFLFLVGTAVTIFIAINMLASAVAEDGGDERAPAPARRETGVAMDYLTLTLLAHLGAHRRLLIDLYTGRVMREEQPAEAARRLRDAFARAPTRAPEGGSGLDPATSDLLAAMTDEMIEDILSRVVMRTEQTSGPATGAAAGRPGAITPGFRKRPA
jgi:hypothetical protein